jgi:hypothetical protein
MTITRRRLGCALLLVLIGANVAVWSGRALRPNPLHKSLPCRLAARVYRASPAAGRRAYRLIIAVNSGKPTAGEAMEDLAERLDGPEQVALLERLLREYPDRTHESFAMAPLFRTYAAEEPAKALPLAQEMLQNSRNGYQAKFWRQAVSYAQDMVLVRRLMAQGKFKEASLLLNQTTVPRPTLLNQITVEGWVDLTAHDLLRSEVADRAGDTEAAFDVLATALVPAPNERLYPAFRTYGAKLNKTPAQVADELWAKRMEKAPIMADFELPFLAGGGTVKLADLRARSIVLVNFWFPT